MGSCALDSSCFLPSRSCAMWCYTPFPLDMTSWGGVEITLAHRFVRQSQTQSLAFPAKREQLLYEFVRWFDDMHIFDVLNALVYCLFVFESVNIMTVPTFGYTVLIFDLFPWGRSCKLLEGCAEMGWNWRLDGQGEKFLLRSNGFAEIGLTIGSDDLVVSVQKTDEENEV